MAAEYIMSEGNYNIVLCERGVRTFADHTRNTLDLSIVPAVQRLSHLPIIVDPSHGTGKRNKVTPLSRAAIAVEDGLTVHDGRMDAVVPISSTLMVPADRGGAGKDDSKSSVLEACRGNRSRYAMCSSCCPY
jgi:hypothetical protein